MLYHLLDDNHLNRAIPVDQDDFEFFHKMTTRTSKVAIDACDILLEIGQKIFKHNYMKKFYEIPVFNSDTIKKLIGELQEIIRCCPQSPSAIFLSNNTTSCDKLVDVKSLFKDRWTEVKAVLDFIGSSKNYDIFDEEDVYLNMF